MDGLALDALYIGDSIGGGAVIAEAALILRGGIVEIEMQNRIVDGGRGGIERAVLRGVHPGDCGRVGVQESGVNHKIRRAENRASVRPADILQAVLNARNGIHG